MATINIITGNNNFAAIFVQHFFLKPSVVVTDIKYANNKNI